MVIDDRSHLGLQKSKKDSRPDEDSFPPRPAAHIFDHLSRSGKLFGEDSDILLGDGEELREVFDLFVAPVELVPQVGDLLFGTRKLRVKMGAM